MGTAVKGEKSLAAAAFAAARAAGERGEVTRITLLAPRAYPLRLDTWPFAILYAAWIAAWLFGGDSGDNSDVSGGGDCGNNSTVLGGGDGGSNCGGGGDVGGGGWWGAPELAMLALGGLACLNAVAYLSTHWNVTAKEAVAWTRVRKLKDATHVRVYTDVPEAKGAIVPLRFETETTKEAALFMFRSRELRLREEVEEEEEEKLIWSQANYPDTLPIAVYQGTRKGLSTKEADDLRAWYGLNTYDIPVPKFAKLYAAQIAAPMFVFQVFCMLLFMLEEYWYLSIFTLCMLFLVENMVVKQRLDNLKELRAMRPDPYAMTVRRDNKWVEVLSDQLVPGDVVSVVRPRGGSSAGGDQVVPCDLLLLAGSCVVDEAMLTGESAPLAKTDVRGAEVVSDGADNIATDATATDAAAAAAAAAAAVLSPTASRSYTLFAGTRVVQASGLTKEEATAAGASGLRAPNNGVVCIVLRTGFGTDQGELVRTILWGTEETSSNGREMLVFVLFLLCFALASAGYVYTAGVAAGRRRYKLIVECLLLITAVIPPELPIQLQLAVRQSLLVINKLRIACTQPFRIPTAGRIDVVCFDKTGTLTAETVVFRGVAGLNSSGNSGDGSDVATSSAKKTKKHHLIRPDELTSEQVETARALALCHGLTSTDDGELVGDPLELEVLDAMGWHYSRAGIASPSKGQRQSVKTLRRFPFSSALKRMSVVGAFEGSDSKLRTLIAVKGAPETLAPMLVDAPSDYAATCAHWAERGARVLAVGSRYIAGNVKSDSKVRALSRADTEHGLSFRGFLIVRSPIKRKSGREVEKLLDSSHHVVMITGDAPLTACYVAEKLKMVQQPVAVLSLEQNSSSSNSSGGGGDGNASSSGSSNEGGGDYASGSTDNDKTAELVWCDTSGSLIERYAAGAALRTLAERMHLCATGPALASLSDEYLADAVPFIRVFARVSPEQKAAIVGAYNNAGLTTLMCGDGTNDVGALKQAHVGVALLSTVPDNADGKRKKKNPSSKQENGGSGTKKAAAATSTAGGRRAVSKRRPVDRQAAAAAAAEKRMAEARAEWEAAMGGPQVPKMGDASMAAPFTAKFSCPSAVTQLVRQGRATLATTLQMLQILALNCLINSYAQSVLYVDGIRLSDMQMTTGGMCIAFCMFSVTRTEAATTLGRERPRASGVNPYLFASVLAQFAIHVTVFHHLCALVRSVEPPVPFDPDAEVDAFEPTLMKTCVFLVSLPMQVSTIAVNYRGAPFMRGLMANRGLVVTLGTLLLLAACGVFGFGAQALELVPVPGNVQTALLTSMAVDFLAVFLADRFAWFVFSPPRESGIVRLLR